MIVIFPGRVGAGETGRPVGVTQAIAHFMRQLERAWDAHLDALLVRRDVAAALAPLAAGPRRHCPSSQRPGAMSLAAWGGPHDPCG